MKQTKLDYKVKPGGQVTGSINVPGDKSISHRSIMFGALAEGTTNIEGFLEGEDSLATLNAFRQMGVSIEGPVNGKVAVHGVGLPGLKKPDGPLYVGNSGTSMRLLAGILAGQDFNSELTGDESLTKRPMRRVADPLQIMGAKITTAEDGKPPIKITGGQSLQGIDYQLPVPSAQVKSCLLLAGMYAQGETKITEAVISRDHTERMLEGFGYPIVRNQNDIVVTGGGHLVAKSIVVPGDISSAAFFMVAASIAPNSELILKNVGINPTRIGIINILQAMGANMELINQGQQNNEPVADIVVKSAKLHGIRIPESQVSLAIDEFPVIFVAAACAEGETILEGAEELRVKETDRIQVMADGLIELGIDAKPTSDGIIIQGGKLTGGTVNSGGDHRIAMAFSVAALRAAETILIKDCANVATSFPNFIDLANDVGIKATAEYEQT